MSDLTLDQARARIKTLQETIQNLLMDFSRVTGIVPCSVDVKIDTAQVIGKPEQLVGVQVDIGVKL